MKKNVIFFFILLVHLSVSSQSSIKLWEGEAATHKQRWSELFVFLPEKQDPAGAAVIICPGGSYYWLDMDNEGFSVAKYLNKQGITAFVLKYRTAKRGNHHPAMIQDLQRAIQLVRENAHQYNIDEKRVGVIGFSAGGHLAGTSAIYGDENFMKTLGIEPQVSQKPYFAVMVYPVVTMREPYAHKKSRKNLLNTNPSNELIKKMSLEENVHNNMPPLLILQTKDDKIVDYHNSVMLAESLTKKGINHKFILYESGGHGFGASPKTETEAYKWHDDFMNWYNEIK